MQCSEGCTERQFLLEFEQSVESERFPQLLMPFTEYPF